MRRDSRFASMESSWLGPLNLSLLLCVCVCGSESGWIFCVDHLPHWDIGIYLASLLSSKLLSTRRSRFSCLRSASAGRARGQAAWAAPR